MIRLAKESDIDEILIIWKETIKQDGRCLAIPFKSSILDLVKKKQFFVFDESGKIVAFGGYKNCKRKGVNKVVNLCVSKDSRGKGVSKKILKAIYNCIKDNGQKTIVECQEGAENNTFWAKFGRQVALKQCKTMNVKIILLDDFILRRL